MKQFFLILKYIGYVAGFTVIVGGVYMAYDNIVDNQEDMRGSVGVISEDVEGLKDTNGRVERKIDGLQEKVDAQDDVLDEFGYLLKKRNDYTDEQIEDLIDRALKKNEKLTVSTETLPPRAEGIR